MLNPFKSLWHHLRRDPVLYAAGLCLLIVGIGLVAISHRIEPRSKLAADILREFGIATFISVTIASLIEIGLARKTFEKGLDAIMKQTVPEEIWDEIKQHVISQPVLRRNWAIVMDIKRKEDGKYVSETTVSYSIESLRDLLTHKVHHEVDGHRVIDGDHCFKSIGIGSDSIDLTKVVKNNKADFSIYFPQEKNKKSVEVKMEERVGESDVINWWMNTQTLGVTVEVHAPATLSVEVHPHHPEKKILAKIENNPRWECKGVMLPGQGFEIRLSPAPTLSASTVALPVASEAARKK
jgi:hypothetical protein